MAETPKASDPNGTQAPEPPTPESPTEAVPNASSEDARGISSAVLPGCDESDQTETPSGEDAPLAEESVPVQQEADTAEETDQSNASAHNSQPVTQDGGDPPPRDAATVEKVDTPNAAAGTNHEEGEEQNSEHKENERLMVKWTNRVSRYTLYLVIVGVVGAVISISALAVIFAQWSVMEAQREDTERLFQNDQRAWLTVEYDSEPAQIVTTKAPVGPTHRRSKVHSRRRHSAPAAVSRVKPPAEFTYAFYWKNVGKTAAHEVKAYFSSNDEYADFGDDLALVTKVQGELLDQTQWPSGRTSARFQISTPGVVLPSVREPANITATGGEEKADQTGRPIRHYFVGRIEYTDAFRRGHSLKFCFFVGHDKGQLHQCAAGNDADRDKPRPVSRLEKVLKFVNGTN